MSHHESCHLSSFLQPQCPLSRLDSVVKQCHRSASLVLGTFALSHVLSLARRDHNPGSNQILPILLLLCAAKCEWRPNNSPFRGLTSCPWSWMFGVLFMLPSILPHFPSTHLLSLLDNTFPLFSLQDGNGGDRDWKLNGSPYGQEQRRARGSDQGLTIPFKASTDLLLGPTSCNFHSSQQHHPGTKHLTHGPLGDIKIQTIARGEVSSLLVQ